MDNLTPITREEMLMNDEPLTPITREEKILAGEDLTPVTRREYFLKKYRHAGGDVMVEELSVTENGTYTAPEGKAYSPVEVAVPMPENAYLLKEASGSLVSFSDGADLPMPSFICKIEAVQSGSGDPSPENVRPISGHTGVDAWVRGKNLLPLTVDGIKAYNGGSNTWINNSKEINGVTYTILTDSDGNVTGIKADGTASAQSLLFYTNITDNSFKGAKLNGYNGQTGSDVCCQVVGYYNESGAWKSEGYQTQGNDYIISDNYAKLYVGFLVRRNKTVDNVILYPMIRPSTETASTYTPYNPNSQTIQVSWQTEAGEVFGGYVDLVNGVLTVDRGSVICNGSESWFYENASAGRNFYYREHRFQKGVWGDNILCNIAKGTTYLSTQKDRIYISISNNVNITIGDSLGIDNAADFKTWLSTHNMQVVAPLATPITYQLTPQQIKSLLGNNNAWCDTGDVDIDYFAKEV